MKKFINKPETVLEEMLAGLLAAYPEKLMRVKDSAVIKRKNDKELGKVGIISGGGSGHEPAHAGFVGYGMLDAAVCGEIFTSPTPDQILTAIKNADRGGGVLMIVKNYSGDVMNFEMARDMAEMEGIKVDYIVVADDVAVENSSFTTGRRGVAGTIFVHKILGSMAEEGKSLSEIKQTAERIIKNIKSFGVAIKACTVPSVGKANFILADDEMEMGIGIHGESGIRKEKLKNVECITKEIAVKILCEFPDKSGDFALLINGMGATPLMELMIVNNCLNGYLKRENIKIFKTYMGNYMTSIDMAGFSITLIKLSEEDKLHLLSKADTVALKEF